MTILRNSIFKGIASVFWKYTKVSISITEEEEVVCCVMTCCLSCLLLAQDCKISNLSSLRKGYFIRLFWRRSSRGSSLHDDVPVWIIKISKILSSWMTSRTKLPSFAMRDDFVGATRKLDFWPPRFSFISFSLIHFHIRIYVWVVLTAEEED